MNIYIPNKRPAKYMKQKLTEVKGEIDISTVKVGNFNSSVLIMDRTSRQKIRKEIENFNNIINQLDLTDIQTSNP